MRNVLDKSISLQIWNNNTLISKLLKELRNKGRLFRNYDYVVRSRYLSRN